MEKVNRKLKQNLYNDFSYFFIIDYFKEYAEQIPGESTNVLSNLAKENKVFLVGGSIPEKDGDKVYNTCTVWNPEGNMIAKHRKVSRWL